MKVFFDKEKLKSVLRDFHELTRATISVWDADFNQLMFYPESMQELCSAVKSSDRGKQCCFESDMRACIKSAQRKRPYTFTCHAGLADTAVPIYYENEIIAYMMFGQIRDREEQLSDFDRVRTLCKKYGIEETEAKRYYDRLPVLNSRQIEAAADFLTMSTLYLHVSQMIKIEQNKLAADIDGYITRNIELPLSVEDLCRRFGISKNCLYDISHAFFNTTIKNYIINKKLDMAKHYLTTTRMPVSQVSIRSGFGDYNYFIRIFRQRTGITPLAYRKKFPLKIIAQS